MSLEKSSVIIIGTKKSSRKQGVNFFLHMLVTVPNMPEPPELTLLLSIRISENCYTMPRFPAVLEFA